MERDNKAQRTVDRISTLRLYVRHQGMTVSKMVKNKLGSQVQQLKNDMNRGGRVSKRCTR